MWKDSVHQLLFGRLKAHSDHEAVYQLGNFRSDHVRSEKLSGFRVENRFDKSSIFTKRDCFAIAGKRKPSHPWFQPDGLGALFCEADTCDLRHANTRSQVPVACLQDEPEVL